VRRVAREHADQILDEIARRDAEIDRLRRSLVPPETVVDDKPRPIFYAGGHPWDAINPSMGEDRPFRIAANDRIVVGMDAAGRTSLLAFTDEGTASAVLPLVREHVPKARLRVLEVADSSCASRKVVRNSEELR